jgi:hypothetical protein
MPSFRLAGKTGQAAKPPLSARGVEFENKGESAFDVVHCLIRQPAEPPLKADHRDGAKSLHVCDGGAIEEREPG